ncbi:MAG: SDR family NAD(P)-dependent oxidoreductase, partial [Bacteroidota bacterium]
MMENTMENKNVLITGANSGIGKASAVALAKQGAHIAMICRNKTKAYNARHDIIKASGSENIAVFICDLA